LASLGRFCDEAALSWVGLLRDRDDLGRPVDVAQATAAEVAQAIIYLASPVSSFTTGTALAVDGGMAGLRLPR
jgi:NAD(P)-dependent dehydrogenase (short-subunit alcohol dehydrogenase family)